MSADKTALGNRMKRYEKKYSVNLLGGVPALARIDGRAFHTFTTGLPRPYDKRLSAIMVEVTRRLVDATNACCGYTQSDEISLVWFTENSEQEIFFNGKLLKMVSVLSSLTTLHFNKLLPSMLPEKESWLATFDARVWEVPTITEATNYFVWREQDAVRNSIQMAARSCYSHEECYRKNTSDLQEMLWQKGINWNDYPRFFKRGTYVRRRQLERPFTVEELESLPPKHNARTHPELPIKRSVVMSEDFPPLTKIVNREGVILFGSDPQVMEEKNE